MNKFNNVSNTLDRVVIDLTVKQMLNPANSDFYIGTLSLAKVEKLFQEMLSENLEIAETFWKAFAIAQNQYLDEQEYIADIEKEYLECIAQDTL